MNDHIETLKRLCETGDAAWRDAIQWAFDRIVELEEETVHSWIEKMARLRRINKEYAVHESRLEARIEELENELEDMMGNYQDVAAAVTPENAVLKERAETLEATNLGLEETLALATIVIDDAQGAENRAHERAETLEAALRELVRLKDFKDTYGKTSSYEIEKDTAWNIARKALTPKPA